MPNSLASVGPDSSIDATPSPLGKYRAAYKRADEFCRDVQGFVAEAGIPAINEMRYAGYHLLEALDDQGGLSNRDDLLKAVNHANRACYEAGEAGILCALDHISAFRRDYRTVSVTGVMTNYTEVLIAAEAARDRVVNEREHSEGRETDYADFIATFRELKAHCRRLDLAREELNKLVRRERRDARRFVIGILIGLATLVGTILAAWFAYVALHPPPTPTTTPVSSMAHSVKPST